MDIHHPPSLSRRTWRILAYTIGILVVALLALNAWMNDFITLHGGRTIYTVDCVGGAWNGSLCTGTLVAGPRYRYRTQKVRSEVLFWIAGSPEPSGKLAPCAIENARNWSCRPGEASTRSIILAMKYGLPVATPRPGQPAFHSVEKWKWFLLDSGVRWFQRADDDFAA